MMRLLRKHTLAIFFVLQSILYAMLLFISAKDVSILHNSVTAGLYLFLIGSILLLCLPSVISYKYLQNIRTERSMIICLTLIAVGVHFFVLRDYPFVGIGDSVRDAGLDAARVLTGELKNIFGSGHYDGFGNFIPYFASIFYRFFGASVLSYRVPAALIAILDCALIYVVIRLVTRNKIASFLSVLAYMSLPLHLFYARTELVVIFDTFWTAGILLAFYTWFHDRKIKKLILLATILGIAANFHSAVRVISIAFALLTILIELRHVVLKNFKHIGLVVVFVAYCFIGFGPSIMYYDQNTFFQKNKASVAPEMHQLIHSKNDLKNLKENYRKSLMVWFYEPTGSHYPAGGPLLPPVFGIVFLLGIGYVLYVERKPFATLLLLFVFLLPFSNSAITDMVNADHRLMPLVPFASIFIAYGIKGIMERLDGLLIKYVFYLILICAIGYNFYTFFEKQPANKDKHIHDYLSMHAIYEVQSVWSKYDRPTHIMNLQTKKLDLCMTVSNENARIFDLIHFREQYKYFLPQFNVLVNGSATVPENEMYIQINSCSDQLGEKFHKRIVDCPNKNAYLCPVDYSGKIKINYLYTDEY